MESFDQCGGLHDRLGEHRTEPIPPELGWDRLGADIRVEVAKRRRRRRPAGWWPFFLAGFGLALLIGYPARPDYPLDAFPLPAGRPVAAAATSSSGGLRSATLPEKQPALSASERPAFRQAIAVSAQASLAAREDSTGYTRISSAPPTDRPRQIALAVEPSSVIPAAASVINRLAQRPAVHPAPAESSHPGNCCLQQEALAEDPSFPASSGPERVDSARQTTWPGQWRAALTTGGNWAKFDYRVPTDSELNPAAYTEPLPGWQASLRIERRWRGAWSIGTGLQAQRLRYRSAFATEERTQLYRPGTIDTIFVSPITGEEMYSYRDSVPGVRIRRFQHHNVRTAWRVPLYVAYTWRRPAFSLGLAAGVHAEISQQQSGRLALTTERVAELAGAARSGFGLQGSTWLETRLDVPLASGLTVQARLGYDRFWQGHSLGEEVVSQRPAAVYGELGLSWPLW